MEYLSKEEIKQWRSSLERITLEEYAKRLGKTLKDEKKTNDIVDMVLSNSTSRYITDAKPSQKEAVVEAAKKSVEMEQDALFRDVMTKDGVHRLNFNKQLTERERKVLDYFVQNLGEIVFAKDLAKILSLPTDYVYKYIKSLRAKIEENVLQNAVKGGYKLSI